MADGFAPKGHGRIHWGEHLSFWSSGRYTCSEFSVKSFYENSEKWKRYDLSNLPSASDFVIVTQWRTVTARSDVQLVVMCQETPPQKPVVRYQKFARKIWRKFITVSNCTKTTPRPIMLHGSCHVPHSFCDEWNWAVRVLFRTRNWFQKKLVPDWRTHVQVSGTRRLVPVSGACVAGIVNGSRRWKLYKRNDKFVLRNSRSYEIRIFTQHLSFMLY